MDENKLKKIFSHIIEELQLPNIAMSLHKSDFEKLEKVHYSIHEFALLPTYFIDSDEIFQAKSAFLMYYNEVFERAHRSFLEAITGHYNAAYTLLRNTCELLIRGAFYECLAHKKFRNKLKSKTKSGKKTLKGLIDELIKENPKMQDQLEKISGSILGGINVSLEEEYKKEISIPNLREIVEQLSKWSIFDPIQEIHNQKPVEIVYDDIYKRLSKDVHVRPDRTDIGRRIDSGEENFFEVKVMPHELNNYMEFLHILMDLGIVIELNILEDLIIQNEDLKNKLEERLPVILDLELFHSSTKIEKLLK